MLQAGSVGTRGPASSPEVGKAVAEQARIRGECTADSERPDLGGSWDGECVCRGGGGGAGSEGREVCMVTT